MKNTRMRTGDMLKIDDKEKEEEGKTKYYIWKNGRGRRCSYLGKILKSKAKETISESALESLDSALVTITRVEERKKSTIGMGFCQKKFYKKTAWDRAVKTMNKLCSLGLAEPCDFGRGKGKYTTDKDKGILIRSSINNPLIFGI